MRSEATIFSFEQSSIVNCKTAAVQTTGCQDESNSREKVTRFLARERGSGMAGMTSTQVLRRRSMQAAAGPLWFLAFEVQHRPAVLELRRKCHVLQRKTHSCSGPSFSVQRGVPPPSARKLPTASVKCLALSRFAPRPKLGARDRPPAPDVAGCAIFCKKKVFEKWQNYACTLTATTWLRCGLDPPVTFVGSVFRNTGARALLQQERRYSGGVETSACRRIRDVNCPQDPAPGRQQYERSRRCP